MRFLRQLLGWSVMGVLSLFGLACGLLALYYIMAGLTFVWVLIDQPDEPQLLNVEYIKGNAVTLLAQAFCVGVLLSALAVGSMLLIVRIIDRPQSR
jgi:hypothetical protein